MKYLILLGLLLLIGCEKTQLEKCKDFVSVDDATHKLVEQEYDLFGEHLYKQFHINSLEELIIVKCKYSIETGEHF